MKWYIRVLLRPVLGFVKQLVCRLIIEGTNHLIEGRISADLASRLNISDEKVDAIIAEFGSALVEFAENNLDAVAERLLSAPKERKGIE